MKYSNQPMTVGGKSFHSRLEAGRYQELLLLEKGGKISDLQTQVTFRLDVGNVHVCKYIADFSYFDQNGAFVVEDTKGFITDVYRLKKKLMKAVHDIDIKEVFSAKRRIPSRAPRGGKK